MAKIVSLGVKLGALVIIVTLPTKYAIELQLLGGVWILQTLPAVVIGLYTRWLHRWALVAGWAVGMTVGTLMAQSQDFAATYPLDVFGTTINAYTGVFALTANLVVTLVLTLLLRRGGAGERAEDAADETQPADYDELAEDTVYPPPRGAPAPVA
jgi:SSS family solute:Na+ symporter